MDSNAATAPRESQDTITPKLTEAQRAMLAHIVNGTSDANGWIGYTRTANALKRRGLIVWYPETRCWDATPAGRAALRGGS